MKKELDVVELILKFAPEFKEESPDDIALWVKITEPQVSKKRFGKLYKQALALLTAHTMKMSGVGDTSTGTVGDSIRVASVSEGNTSVSFNTSMYSSDNPDAELGLTPYGIRYKRIRSLCIIPVVSSGEK